MNDFKDILNWKYTATPLPQFSWEKKEVIVPSIADLTDEFSSIPIERFGRLHRQKREQMTLPMTQVMTQPMTSPNFQEYPNRFFQRKKGHPILFREFLIVAIFLGFAVAVLGNPGILTLLGDGFMSGIKHIGSFFV